MKHIVMMVVAAMSMSSPQLLAAEKSWTRSAILAIADAEAQRLGYDIEQMSVEFDAYNSTWREHLRAASLPDVEAKLEGREYWAVHYASLQSQRGGDLFVFVNRATGEVITVTRGR